MRQEGGALPYLRPHKPEHVQAIQASRNRERREREKQPTPEIDIYPTHAEYQQYIEKNQLDTAEKKLSHERKLTEALSEAMFFGQTEKIENIRRTIWMLSEYTHQTSQIPSEKIEELAREKARTILHASVEHHGDDARDISERVQEHEHEFQIWHSLFGALRDHLTGKELMNALKVEDSESETSINGSYDPLADFEYRYNSAIRDATHYHNSRQKEGKAEIQTLRIIRDRLYYNLLFPVLATMRYQKESRSKRKAH